MDERGTIDIINSERPNINRELQRMEEKCEVHDFVTRLLNADSRPTVKGHWSFIIGVSTGYVAVFASHYDNYMPTVSEVTRIRGFIKRALNVPKATKWERDFGSFSGVFRYHLGFDEFYVAPSGNKYKLSLSVPIDNHKCTIRRIDKEVTRTETTWESDCGPGQLP